MFSRVQKRYFENRTIPHVASIAALAYLLYVGISTLQSSANPEQPASLASEPGQQAEEKIDTKRMDFLLIKDWHLFGKSETLAAQNSGQHEIPQETQLQLKLLGVFFLPDQKKTSYAIIETDDHVQKKYRPGDELPGDTTLQSIAKYQVILLRNNQREALSMDREKTKLPAKT
jgi:Type II secretion system protein C